MSKRRTMNMFAAAGIAAGLLAATPATAANAAPAAASDVPTGLFQLDSDNGPILSMEAVGDPLVGPIDR